MRRALPAAVACIAAAVLGASLGAGHLVSAFEALNQWDGHWYAMIAEGGYWYRAGEQSPVAFFPGFALCIAALRFFGLSSAAGGVLLSLVFGLAALELFRRLARRLSPASAETAATTFALYPLAFFLYGAVYSDGLFLLLLLAAFSSLEKDRPGLAALFGALATACRPLAPVVVLGLLARSLERRVGAGHRVRAVDLLPLLACAGFVAYVAYLHVEVGDGLAFVHAQAAPGWDQPPGWHTWSKITFIDAFRSGRLEWFEQVRLVGHALATALALLLVVPTWRRFGVGYALFAAGAVLMPAVSSKDFIGMGRYVMASFPLFLTAGALLHDRPRLRIPWWALSGGLLLLLAFHFGAGAYLS